MMKTLEKKLRKLFRKQQWKYRWLGFEENAYKLVAKLPLSAYEELERGLTDAEFYELRGIFIDLGKKKILFAIFPSDVWIKRCCSNSNLFDTLWNSQLKEILNYADDILKLFLATNEERQCRLLSILDEEMLENFFHYARKEYCNAINQFLVWLCVKEENEVCTAKQEEIANIFRKIANLSDATIAKILENMDAVVMRRILEEIRKTERDLLSICKQIREEKLYDVLSKSDFALLERADSHFYSWFCANLFESDKVEYLAYLADEKLEQIGLFDAEICARIFALDYMASWKVKFVKKVFATRSAEDFNAFYEELSQEEKELMFEILLQSEDGEAENIVKVFLKEKYNLSLLESLLKEKYVTD